MPDFADYGPRRRVSGGLRARSARGAIGVSWWSRRFLDVLESFALGTRLTRGRSYARSGQVLALDVAPGLVTASVQGSRPTPYRVRIGLQVFAEADWTRLEELLAAQALFSARLLAGDLPPELEEVFAEADAPLFPSSVRELAMSCSCPDFAIPCKHLAATFYLLAEAFDADPFQLLRWRGRGREQLLARLRAIRTSGGGAAAGATADGRSDDADLAADAGPLRREGPAMVERPDRPGTVDGVGPVVGAGLALVDLPDAPAAEQADRFWHSPVPLPDRAATIAAEVDLLLRQLGVPGRDIGGPGLTERLRRAYDRFPARADGSPPP